MSFTTPLALLLLLLIPYFVAVSHKKGTAFAAYARRDWLSLGLRLLIVALLVLSLAGAQAVQAADELAVVFLLDVSDSMGAEQVAAAEAFVGAAISRMQPNDQAAVVVFGADALVERPMSSVVELAPVTSVPQTLQTDIAAAVRLSLALFPAGAARRIVLLSDGAATTGDTSAAARLAAATDVPVDVVFLARPTAGPEVTLLDVQAPARVAQGERFRLEVRAESTVETAANLRVFGAGSLLYDEQVQLRPGLNNFTLALQAAEPEFARYRVQLSPAADTFFQNNELAAFTEVTGPPRVLLVASDGTLADDGTIVAAEAAPLSEALAAAGVIVEQTTPAEMPATLEALSNYGSVVLVNVNAKNLSPRKMALLQSYVRDLGGGLVIVGGPESYGVGGYFGTPLEETLPVDMQITDQERFPAVSIALVIDRSGSMAQEESGIAKIQLANEGAVRVVQLLNDEDEITVIPIDTEPDDVVGPLPASEREAAIAAIRQIGAGGGGIYVYTGLRAAADALVASSNPIKHIILLADGADAEEKEGVPDLIAELTAQGVTVSTVSIGPGPDTAWLQQMAELGNGRFHFTDQAANLPQIFTQETTAIQRSYIIEERFFPGLNTDSPILAGIDQVPPLYGYVGTSAKDTAQVILTTHLGDPLLAAWQYGLGRAVAWTSDATGRWAADWVRWQAFPAFWAQTVRWTVSEVGDSNTETAVALSGDTAQLTVDVRDEQGAFRNSLNMEANVIAPDGSTRNLTLTQTAPGRYQGDFAPEAEGAYLIRVAGGEEDGDAVVGQTLGWVLGYSPEYRDLNPEPQQLSSIAGSTAGRDLTGLAPAEAAGAIFAHDLPAQRTVRPIWPWLTLLAVLLLPLDIAVRRLVVTRSDLARAWARTFGRLVPEPAPAPERSEQVARLFEAKQRAANTQTGPVASEASPTPPLTAEAGPPPAETGVPKTVAPAAPETGDTQSAGSQDTLAARLRRRRETHEKQPGEEGPA